MNGTEKLSNAHRAIIVQRLAAYESQKSIVAMMRAEFGISITAKAIAHYDPTNKKTRRLAAKWQQLFEATRARIDADQIDLTARVWRLRSLDVAARQATLDGHHSLALQLRRAAEREIQGIEPTQLPQTAAGAGESGATRALTDEQRLRALSALIDKVNAESGFGADDNAVRPDEEREPA
jgi:hypothetical protein